MSVATVWQDQEVQNPQFAEPMSKLKSGYAYDLCEAFLTGSGRKGDAEALFRTLVLDERWNVPDAEALWMIAYEVAKEDLVEPATRVKARR